MITAYSVIVQWYRLRGSIPSRGKICSVFCSVQTGSESPWNLLLSALRLFPQDREAEWLGYASSLPDAFMARCLFIQFNFTCSHIRMPVCWMPTQPAVDMERPRKQRRKHATIPHPLQSSVQLLKAEFSLRSVPRLIKRASSISR
jgi:hypothetical protein